MPLGTEVNLGPGDVLLDGDLAPPRKGPGTPICSAHVYCAYGRPFSATAELLLSLEGSDKASSFSNVSISVMCYFRKLL